MRLIFLAGLMVIATEAIAQSSSRPPTQPSPVSPQALAPPPAILSNDDLDKFEKVFGNPQFFVKQPDGTLSPIVMFDPRPFVQLLDNRRQEARQKQTEAIGKALKDSVAVPPEKLEKP